MSSSPSRLLWKTTVFVASRTAEDVSAPIALVATKTAAAPRRNNLRGTTASLSCRESLYDSIDRGSTVRGDARERDVPTGAPPHVRDRAAEAAGVQADGRSGPRHDDRSAVGGERGGAAVQTESLQLALRRDVPEANRPVQAGRHNEPRVRAHRRRQDGALVPGERRDEPARARVPDPRPPVGSGRDELPAVRCELEIVARSRRRDEQPPARREVKYTHVVESRDRGASAGRVKCDRDCGRPRGSGGRAHR